MRFFFFGTLMDSDVMSLVTGRPLDALKPRKAWLPGYQRMTVRGELFPLITATEDCEVEGCEVEGLLVESLSAQDLDRILFFEGIEYDTQTVRLRLGDGAQVEAEVFSQTDLIDHDGTPWDYQAWCARDKAQLLAESRAWMLFYGHLSAAQAEVHWQKAKMDINYARRVVAQLQQSKNSLAKSA